MPGSSHDRSTGASVSRAVTVAIIAVFALFASLASGCGTGERGDRTDVAGDASVATDGSSADFDRGGDAGGGDGGSPEDATSTSDADSSLDTGATFPGTGATADSLPVEVLGPPGTSVTVVADLKQLSANIAVELSLFNVVDAEMARLWINREYVIELGEPALEFVQSTSGVTTGTIDVPSQWLVEGPNLLTFEYTHQVPDVSGFRVLEFAVASDSTTVFELSERDDPTQWVGYDDSPEAIERGRSYFQEISRDGGPTCSRCHADDGADFEYYSFSNESIVARSMFHEFSREEGEEIASYLRSLEVEREGRLWIAPFQPGPNNYGAAGDGVNAIIDDGQFGVDYMQGLDVPWDWAAGVDTYRTRTSVQLPTWFRWLPRELDDDWFERRDGELAAAEVALAQDPTLENAHAFMAAAVRIGKDIMVENGDHQGRIDLLRFAAVKLWDWSRKQGFDEAHHGFPNDEWGNQGFWGSPPYPYEVGFAFFEAEIAGLRDAYEQTTQWWWLQIAVDPGRGRSNGSRPLNYADVLRAAEFEVGPRQLGFLHLLGSWEENRGPMADSFGDDVGPVRLLAIPMSHLAPDDRVEMMLRHLSRTGQHVSDGGELTSEHHALLADAWSIGCEDLTPAQRATVRNSAPLAVAEDLGACSD